METTQTVMLKNDRSGLISVPLWTRPKDEEIRPYLRSFQAYIMEKSLSILEDQSGSTNNLDRSEVDEALRKLVTSLSTKLEYVRLPIVWAQYNRLVHLESVVIERMLESTAQEYRDVLRTTGIFLSHFDIVRHLSDAEKRVARGEDKIDEALFFEIEELVKEFDRSRAEIFANEVERTNRIRAVLDLPSGALPRITVMMYRAVDFASYRLMKFSRLMLSIGGVLFVVASLLDTPTVRAVFDVFISWVKSQ